MYIKYIKYYMYLNIEFNNMEKTTVKARSRQGTKSMDLTIPAKVCDELNISPGDIFELTVTKDKNEILTYKRVYKIK